MSNFTSWALSKLINGAIGSNNFSTANKFVNDMEKDLFMGKHYLDNLVRSLRELKISSAENVNSKVALKKWKKETLDELNLYIGEINLITGRYNSRSKRVEKLLSSGPGNITFDKFINYVNYDPKKISEELSNSAKNIANYHNKIIEISNNRYNQLMKSDNHDAANNVQKIETNTTGHSSIIGSDNIIKAVISVFETSITQLSNVFVGYPTTITRVNFKLLLGKEIIKPEYSEMEKAVNKLLTEQETKRKETEQQQKTQEKEEKKKKEEEEKRKKEEEKKKKEEEEKRKKEEEKKKKEEEEKRKKEEKKKKEEEEKRKKEEEKKKKEEKRGNLSAASSTLNIPNPGSLDMNHLNNAKNSSLSTTTANSTQNNNHLNNLDNEYKQCYIWDSKIFIKRPDKNVLFNYDALKKKKGDSNKFLHKVDEFNCLKIAKEEIEATKIPLYEHKSNKPEYVIINQNGDRVGGYSTDDAGKLIKDIKKCYNKSQPLSNIKNAIKTN